MTASLTCDVCGRSFSAPNALGSHRAYVHEGRQPARRPREAPDSPPAITVGFSPRELDGIERLARREGCTPAAIVRAAVQRALRGESARDV